MIAASAGGRKAGGSGPSSIELSGRTHLRWVEALPRETRRSHIDPAAPRPTPGKIRFRPHRAAGSM
jgi:hypothetical protein